LLDGTLGPALELGELGIAEVFDVVVVRVPERVLGHASGLDAGHNGSPSPLGSVDTDLVASLGELLSN